MTLEFDPVEAMLELHALQHAVLDVQDNILRFQRRAPEQRTGILLDMRHSIAAVRRILDPLAIRVEDQLRSSGN